LQSHPDIVIVIYSIYAIVIFVFVDIVQLMLVTVVVTGLTEGSMRSDVDLLHTTASTIDHILRGLTGARKRRHAPSSQSLGRSHRRRRHVLV
jgi:hypothetical protein